MILEVLMTRRPNVSLYLRSWSQSRGHVHPLPPMSRALIVTNRRKIWTKFNECFVNVARNLDSDKYNNLDVHDHKQYLRNSVNNSLFLLPITDNEAHDIISLDSSKSSAISPKLLKPKALCNSFCPILSYLFNSCMLSGTFLDELKIARVMPLFKSGNRNLMSNYRPISILPTLSKIFEKLIHSRIYQFPDENQVLYNYQFGFRKAHSNSTQFKQLYILSLKL